ncbi:MAG TPA: ATP-grasp domain-containing protein [Patescibacteria group bacterium]|nr:ATP-grasp domain-containing protein [Patescibacteria group bacterium]
MTIQNLPLEYNKSTPIGVVGTDPYNFLLYQKFFDDFQIITEVKQDWLHDLPIDDKVKLTWLGRSKQYGESPTRMLRSKKFVEMVKADPKRKYVLYSPLDPPYKVNPLTYLMNSPTIAHAYENKRYFRDEFADLIRVPEYEIRYMGDLDRAAAYRDLRERFGGSFVLQDEESSGSKGTYVIHDQDEYVDAVKNLKKYSEGRTIVVSQFLKGENSSIQVCITKHGIFSGGIQRQLLDSKYLCNPKLAGASKWCGGEVGTTYPDIVRHQAQEIATIVGSELASHGYKGIFGIDLIVTPTNEVYAIEINARLTGYSHIISELELLEGKIPMMLLHALELGNFKYEITDLEALPSSGVYKKPVSLLIMNNPLAEDITLKNYIRPGLYKYKDGKISFVKEAYSIDTLKGDDTFLIFSRHNTGDTIESGKRILKIAKFGKTMSKGELNTKTQDLTKAIKKHFKLPQ